MYLCLGRFLSLVGGRCHCSLAKQSQRNWRAPGPKACAHFYKPSTAPSEIQLNSATGTERLTVASAPASTTSLSKEPPVPLSPTRSCFPWTGFDVQIPRLEKRRKETRPVGERPSRQVRGANDNHNNKPEGCGGLGEAWPEVEGGRETVMRDLRIVWREKSAGTSDSPVTSDAWAMRDVQDTFSLSLSMYSRM